MDMHEHGPTHPDPNSIRSGASQRLPFLRDHASSELLCKATASLATMNWTAQSSNRCSPANGSSTAEALVIGDPAKHALRSFGDQQLGNARESHLTAALYGWGGSISIVSRMNGAGTTTPRFSGVLRYSGTEDVPCWITNPKMPSLYVAR